VITAFAQALAFKRDDEGLTKEYAKAKAEEDVLTLQSKLLSYPPVSLTEILAKLSDLLGYNFKDIETLNEKIIAMQRGEAAKIGTEAEANYCEGLLLKYGLGGRQRDLQAAFSSFRQAASSNPQAMFELVHTRFSRVGLCLPSLLT